MKQKASLKTRALRYLAAREHSKKELADKLLRFAEEEDDLEGLLGWLEAEGFLSDVRFAHSLVRTRIKGYGNSRIKYELRQHQVHDSLEDAAVLELMQNEYARARQVREKKFGEIPADAGERARQMNFLQRRGFSNDAIRKAMAEDMP